MHGYKPSVPGTPGLSLATEVDDIFIFLALPLFSFCMISLVFVQLTINCTSSIMLLVGYVL